MKKRLLFIGPLPPPYGGARVTFQLLVDHLRARNEVSLFVVRTWNPERGMLHKLGSLFRILWCILWRSSRNDIIVLFASDKGVVFLGPWIHIVARFFRKPWMVRNFGGSLDLSYDRLPRLERAILSWILKSADRYLLVTQDLIRKFRRKVPQGKFELHANYRPMTQPCVDRGTCSRFVFLGKVKPTKGVGEIIAACQTLSEEITVDVYGPLQDGVSEETFAACRNVRYRGVVPPDEISHTIEEYDALLLPTYYEGEGYPGAILEAYSTGMPVIASRWRAIPEIVDDTSGILVEPGSVEELAQAMSRLNADEQLYHLLCEGACAKRHEFALESKAEEFLAHCQDVLYERRGYSDAHG